jgi:hypothetical protein
MSLRRECDDEVEIGVIDIVHRSWLAVAERQALFLQHDIDEGIALSGMDTG